MKGLEPICVRLSFLLFLFLLWAGCGNDLSQRKAANMLRNSLPPLAAVFVEDVQAGSYIDNISGVYLSYRDLSLLRKAGYVTIPQGFARNIRVTGKLRPYFINAGEGTPFGSKFWNLEIAKVRDVRVSSISKRSGFFGKKVCEAAFTVEYGLTPIGEMLSKKPRLTDKGRALFVLYGHGWKLDIPAVCGAGGAADEATGW
ncbi:MAG: hypothetical protein ABSC19_06885 [Syntrophorhabdales bacterium]